MQPHITRHIMQLREQRVMLDSDLAALYGVAMLSSILNSPRGIAINIEIMRAFVQIRSLALSHQDLAKRLASMEAKHDSFNRQTQRDLKEVFDTLRELMTPPTEPLPPKNPIGFVWSGEKPAGKAKPKAIKGKAGKG